MGRLRRLLTLPAWPEGAWDGSAGFLTLPAWPEGAWDGSAGLFTPRRLATSARRGMGSSAASPSRKRRSQKACQSPCFGSSEPGDLRACSTTGFAPSCTTATTPVCLPGFHWLSPRPLLPRMRKIHAPS